MFNFAVMHLYCIDAHRWVQLDGWQLDVLSMVYYANVYCRNANKYNVASIDSVKKQSTMLNKNTICLALPEIG